MTLINKEKINFSTDGSGPLEKQYFVDPTRPDGAKELARLGGEVIETLGKIYSYRGDIDKLRQQDPETYLWLNSKMHGEGRQRLRSLMGEVLMREFETRRFDELFMGQLHPQGSEAAILGAMIGIYMNTNTIVKEVSIAEHEMEWEVLDWYAEMFGYDKNTYSGNIVTGGTSANITALWVAREKSKYELQKRDRSEYRKHNGKVERSYRVGQKSWFIASGMSHYSISKAVGRGRGLLGDNAFLARAETQGFKTSPKSVEELIIQLRKRGEHVAGVIGLAGETETGLVDNLVDLGEVCRKYGVHFHVDAAYGGPFIMSNASHLFKGIELADSITVDPHKYGFVPYHCGIVLFKDSEAHALVQKDAPYLQEKDNKGILGPREKRNFGLSARIEGSMGSGGAISAWVSMRLFGRKGYASLLNHGIKLAEYAHELVEDSHILRPLHRPELNGLLVGIDSNLENDRRTDLVARSRQQLFEETGIYIADTGKLDCGGGCFRTVFTHPFTNEHHVEMMVQNLERIVWNNIR